MVAVVFAFAGAAFTAKKTTHTVPNLTSEWYYLFNSNSSSDRFDATKYIYIDPQPSAPEDVAGCDGFTLPCVIQATGTQNGNPDPSEVSDQTHLNAVTKTMKN